MIMQALKNDIAISLGEFLGNYDIDAIASEIEEKYPAAQRVDDVESDNYWSIVQRHDITPTGYVAAVEWDGFGTGGLLFVGLFSDPREAVEAALKDYSGPDKSDSSYWERVDVWTYRGPDDEEEAHTWVLDCTEAVGDGDVLHIDTRMKGRTGC